MRGARVAGAVVLVVVLALTGWLLCGCGGIASTPSGDGEGAETGTSSGETADAGGGSSAGDRIPEGRSFAEGGGGPKSYTFREEWRRGLVSAQAWRKDAYLVAAVGRYVNDDGVPSEWRLTFIDSDKPDALLFVTVDPWGKVTGTRELTGSDVSSNVSGYDKDMPYDVIDSDEAVRIGKETLGAEYALEKTKDPALALGYSVIDGSGPWWTYTVFYNSTAEYVSARIDARSGAATVTE